MMKDESRNFMLGTIIGIVLGGAAAILLAPAEGAETRRKLRETADQAREKVKDLAAKGKDFVHVKQSQLHEAVEAGRRAAKEKREEIEDELHAQTHI